MRLFRTNYRKETDERLMQFVAKGDARAFEALYDRYSDRLLNYFYRMLWRDREKAEDFMQDLFTKLLSKPEAFDPKRSFKPWLFSIANNMCKNEYEKQAVRSGEGTELANENLAANEPTMPDHLDWDAFNQSLDRELALLDEKHRTSFVLRYREELSIREISVICDCSEGTVKSRLFYALRKLTPKLSAFRGIKSTNTHG